MGRGSRVLSIDLLRGLDVLLMLFANEMAGVRDTPAFLRHVPASADGMTITDVVFPAFLFVTGMAVPLALGARLARGDSRIRLLGHVAVRTLALLALGVLMINAERASDRGPLPPALWNIAATIAAVLVWGEWRTSERRRRTLRVAGLVLLVALAFAYRSDAVAGAFQMRPYWWGILGLIGWAYLVAATAYLLAGDRPWLLLAAAALLYAVALVDHLGLAPGLAVVGPIVSVGSMWGAHGGLAVSGAVLGAALRQDRVASRRLSALVPVALAYAAVLAGAGLAVHALREFHPAFTISKVKATVAWCLLSAASTVLAWVAVYGSADVRGHSRWPAIVRTAGENALLVYLLAPFLLSAFQLVASVTGHHPYAIFGGSLAAGVLRSIAFAWIVVFMAGGLRARGVVLKL
jgi:predicted acyltransferase